MPTLIYLVHGMGCGTADGTPRADADRWSNSVVAAYRWMADTLGLAAPTVLDPVPADPPAGADHPDAVWLVPVTYHQAFDEFRASSADREARAAGLGVLADADVTRLASADFLWVNCLDVFLWWADTAQTRNRVTSTVLDTIATADQLAARVAGATTRRLVVSHSLGTAVTTYALRHLAQRPAWVRRGGIDAWFTLANVAPFLLPPADVYAPPLIPGEDGALVAGPMYNARNEFDPIPWLLPWRAFSEARAGAWASRWATVAAARRFRLLETHGVAAPPNGTPGITDVHGFANYLMAPDVAIRLGALARGAAFGPDELAARHWPDAWSQLPALRCTRSPEALDDLAREVGRFVNDAPHASTLPGDSTQQWIGRLLRGMQILLSASDKC